VSSFNLEALGRAAVQDGMTLAEALLALWNEGARQFLTGLTPDPAGVSAPIKVENLPLAQQRMQAAANALAEALAHDDDKEAVREALSRIFFDYIEPPSSEKSKSGLAAVLRSSSGGAGITSLGLGLGRPVVHPKPTRAYGAPPHR